MGDVESADRRGWGPPPTPRSSIATVYVGRAHVPLPVHVDVAPLVQALADAWDLEVEPLRDGECWGYAPRKVRGSSTTWSNHAWGLAIDLNAPAHPMGKAGTFTAAQERAARRLLARFPRWRWGEDFRRVDGMHLEYLGTPQDARQDVAALRRRGAEETIDVSITKADLEQIVERVVERKLAEVVTGGPRRADRSDPNPRHVSTGDLLTASDRVEAKVDDLAAKVEALAKDSCR